MYRPDCESDRPRPQAECDPTRGRAETEGDAEYTGHTRLGRNAFERFMEAMEAFDNGFRTGPYRKVRPGPEPVIERYRGPAVVVVYPDYRASPTHLSGEQSRYSGRTHHVSPAQN
ncbi:hypothetical protein Bbelb_115200 [Branchiostoma belcheri]|nr:hypothetical protein Bbelb_115200 [Branchiostoma belcheri]